MTDKVINVQVPIIVDLPSDEDKKQQVLDYVKDWAESLSGSGVTIGEPEVHTMKRIIVNIELTP